MKITRSALKSLIKEEMNRIGEAGDRVAGEDQVGAYAFDGMKAEELSDIARMAYKGRSDRFNLEGLMELKRELLKIGDAKRNVPNRASGTLFSMSLEGSVAHAEVSIPDVIDGESYPEYNDTMDRTGYVQLSVRPDDRDAPDGEPLWSEESKRVVDEFNAQNAGLGGILTDKDDGRFNFRQGDGSPDPKQGMNFTIKLS